MKNLIFRLLLIACFIPLLQGCSLDNEDDSYCYSRNYMATISVTGPETATVNTPVEFQVTFLIANSCGVFYNFAEFNTDYPKEIAAAVDYTGCNCGTTSTQVTKPYTFTAPAAGTYTLHFLTEDAEQPIEKVIVITE